MDTRAKTSTLLTVIFGLVAAAIIFLPTSKPDLIPRKLLFGNPEKTTPLISPDGKQLAYLAPDAQDVLNIWIQPLIGADKTPHQVTSDKKRGIRQFLWQYDNHHLLYVQDMDGDENWHVYQADPTTHVTRDLTPFQGIRADLVAYQPSHPDTLLVQMNLLDRSRFDIYRLDLRSGALVLDTTNPDQALSMIADNDLVIRAAQSYTEDGGTLIRVRDDAQSPWRELLRWGQEETLGGFTHFSPDNKFLYVITSLGGDTSRLLKVDLATGDYSEVASDPTYDIGTVLLHPEDNALQAVGVQRERFHWIPLDPALESDFAYLEKLGSGSFQIPSRSHDDKQWVIAMQSDTRPPEYYIYDREAKKAEFLFNSRPSLEKYSLSAMKPIQFEASDGMQLHGYLTLPTGYHPRGLPTVIFVHGGPWSRDDWGFVPTVQWLANRGYAVVQVNFRGSTGYGKALLNAGNHEWGRKMAQDLIDAKNWVIKEGYANPDRVAIFGGSYGGYATLAALTFTPLEFCCGIDVVGPSNLTTLLQTVPPYWKPGKLQFDRRVGSLETDAAMLTERSPVHQAGRIVRPLLIGHGAHDPRVKQSESDQIVSAMRQNNQLVEYLLFPDEGHGFARPENRLRFHAAAEHFLVQQLGGRAEAPVPEERWDDVKQ